GEGVGRARAAPRERRNQRLFASHHPLPYEQWLSLFADHEAYASRRPCACGHHRAFLARAGPGSAKSDHATGIEASVLSGPLAATLVRQFELFHAPMDLQ